MSSQHIENLKVVNFKCFKDLEVSNIGQVNLIGGKNNVGKTAFLEAVDLLVSLNDKEQRKVISVYRMLKRRQGHSKPKYFDIDFIFNGESEICISSLSENKKLIISKGIFYNGHRFIHTEYVINEGIGTTESGSNDTHPMQESDEVEMNDYLFFIYPSKVNEEDIANYFGAVIDLNLEHFLNKSLSSFDENILEFKSRPIKNGTALKLKLKDNDSLVLLSSLGEGINRYIAILCAIWASKDSVLLIDEIENGIHYTNYKKLWQIIFQASIDANCQVFATTHSKECIEAFNQVQFENEACNAQYFEFYRDLKKDLIVSSNIDKEQLRYSLTHEGRVRGE